MTGTSAGGGIETGWLLIVLWGILAYFVYDGVGGVLAIVLLGILFALSTILALIPFGMGVVAQVLVMKFVILPFVLDLTGLSATWLTGVMFWVYIVLGIITTIVITLAIVVAILDR